MTMQFVLLDQSNGAKTTDGSVMTSAVLTAIAAAVNVQLNRDFAAEYGGQFAVRAGANGTDVQGSEIPFALLANLSSAPGAIAYHTTNGNGQPLLYDGITLSDSLFGSGNSVSCAISHELLETAADPGANLWAADNVANAYTREVCDPFEERTYMIPIDGKSIAVSDFALQAYFIPGAKGPYSFMRRGNLLTTDASAALAVNTSMGYQMIAPFNVQGEHQAAMAARHLCTTGTPKRRPIPHAGSRRAKRGWKI